MDPPQTCGGRIYTGNASYCREIEFCDIPLKTNYHNVINKSCQCADGYWMTDNKTCIPSCVNTPYDGVNETCTKFPNCVPPPSGRGLCKCAPNMVPDKIGICNTTCGNTNFTPGVSNDSDCSQKVGCLAPNATNATTCVCYNGGFLAPRADGTCQCQPPAQLHSRASDCSCPPGMYYTTPLPTKCAKCSPGTYRDRIDFDACRSPPPGATLLQNQTGIKCQDGYAYSPPIPWPDSKFSNCTKCDEYSYLIQDRHGRKQKCFPCPLNQVSDNNRTSCSCAPGFETLENGTCVCPAGYYYIKRRPPMPGSCIRCTGNTYIPTAGLEEKCRDCTNEADANQDNTNCLCKDKSVFFGGRCAGACTSIVYQVSASCNALGCTWPRETFGNCRCQTEKHFVEDEHGNCHCKEGYDLVNNTACVNPKAGPGLSMIILALIILIGCALIAGLVIYKRKVSGRSQLVAQSRAL